MRTFRQSVTASLIALALSVTAAVSQRVSAQPEASGSSASSTPLAFAPVRQLFRTNCAVCHNSEEKPGNLSLEGDDAYANIVAQMSSEAPGRRLVDPGKPESSYLLAKMKGEQARLGGSGDAMPVGQGPLPEDKIALVERWIAEGASR